MSVARPSGAGFDLALLAHVVAALVSLVAVTASGGTAAWLLLLGSRPVPAGARSYFARGVNWLGRVLYLVPILGVALVGMSRGAYGFDDGWVDAGIGLWVVAAAAGECLLWPAERRIQAALEAPAGTRPESVLGTEGRRACALACAAAAAIVALLVVAVVVMVAQP